MRSAEGAQEIVERFLIGQVDHSEAKAPLITVSMKKIVLANREVKEIPGRDARRIFVVVFRAVCGDADPLRPAARWIGATTCRVIAEWES
jgi:hypothetical protein